MGLRAVVCSWNICLLYSPVKLWSGEERRGIRREEIEEEKEESVKDVEKT